MFSLQNGDPALVSVIILVSVVAVLLVHSNTTVDQSKFVVSIYYFGHGRK